MLSTYQNYLMQHLPLQDRGVIDEALLKENCKYASLVREEVPCSMNIPEEIFLNYVLPHACLDEKRDRWRPLLFDTFQEVARRAASIEDAVVTLNRLVFDTFDVQYHPTKRPHNNMSPLESIECGFASCTGLSILIVSTLRAVGIPARIAGTPLWSDGSGNHTWFEVWDHGMWHFMGAAEPGAYDLCWFNDIAKTSSIYTAGYAASEIWFPLSWDAKNESIPGQDASERYKQCAPRPVNPTTIVVEPKGYVCQRASTPITINGRIDKPEWDVAPWTDYFVDIEGAKKPTPRYHTRAKMLWDDDYLYVGALLEDPHVWGSLTEKNSIIFNDNDFEIFIDPDGDNHNYYEFEINPLGTIWELSLDRPYRDGGPICRGDNMPGLKSAVHIDGTLNDPSDTDNGWSVEVAIPWKGLERYGRCGPPAEGDQWRINFSRVHWLHEVIDGKYVKVPRDAHPEDNWVWTPQEAIDMHRPERWGYLQFTSEPDTRFVRDPSWPLRELLMELYYQQKESRSTTMSDFVFRGVRDAGMMESLKITESESGWTASASLVLGDKTLSMSVDQHGQLLVDR